VGCGAGGQLLRGPAMGEAIEAKSQRETVTERGREGLRRGGSGRVAVTWLSMCSAVGRLGTGETKFLCVRMILVSRILHPAVLMTTRRVVLP
jgi:hypothetical protein